jgi:hypothetical protein
MNTRKRGWPTMRAVQAAAVGGISNAARPISPNAAACSSPISRTARSVLASGSAPSNRN